MLQKSMTTLVVSTKDDYERKLEEKEVRENIKRSMSLEKSKVGFAKDESMINVSQLD